MIYLYDNMTDEDWKEYEEGTKDIIKKIKKRNRPSNDAKDLNKKWLDFRKSLIELTQETKCGERSKSLIKQRKININRRIINHFKETPIYQQLCFIRKLIKKLKKADKYKEKNLFDINWISKKRLQFTKNRLVATIKLNNKQKDELKNIIEKVKYEGMDLFTVITTDNIKEYIEELENLNKNLKFQYNINLKTYKETQIRNFVQERCDNLMENKKGMINSFMNREVKSVVIDRVVVTKNEAEILITKFAYQKRSK